MHTSSTLSILDAIRESAVEVRREGVTVPHACASSPISDEVSTKEAFEKSRNPIQAVSCLQPGQAGWDARCTHASVQLDQSGAPCASRPAGVNGGWHHGQTDNDGPPVFEEEKPMHCPPAKGEYLEFVDTPNQRKMLNGSQNA